MEYNKGGDILKYEHVVEGIFLHRDNRFVAKCTVEGREVTAYVPNTGRCRELLIPGTKVYLTQHDTTLRKTAYTLISVYKGSTLINIDSSAPNKVVAESLLEHKLDVGFPIVGIKPEFSYGKSRMDFYVWGEREKMLMEVKGVTLEKEGILSFPDAPTLRGLKHIGELQQAVKEGYRAGILFLVQMEIGDLFVPNHLMQPEFGKALQEAKERGVEIYVYRTQVTKDTIGIKEQIPYDLEAVYEF